MRSFSNALQKTLAELLALTRITKSEKFILLFLFAKSVIFLATPLASSSNDLK
jgi:hypothetical protein